MKRVACSQICDTVRTTQAVHEWHRAALNRRLSEEEVAMSTQTEYVSSIPTFLQTRSFMIFVTTMLMIVCLCGVVYGQDLGNPMNPADSQAYDKFGVDSINIQNLSIDIDLPVFSKRGAIPFSYVL